MALANGITGGNFTNTANLQAETHRAGTVVTVTVDSSRQVYSIDSSDLGGGLALNDGLYANPVFNPANVRGSLLDNPLCHFFKTNKLVETSAPTGTDSDIVWTRSTIATFVNRYGIIKTAAIDTPREEKEGFLFEGVSTNLALHNRDYTNAVFIKTNITPVKDATGRDDVVNAASSLTATASNATCFQVFVLASQENTYSVDVKRKTGAGTIEMTDNGGSTYTDITSLINSETYVRLDITSTQENPSIGFRISVSGDAIEVDYTQLENITFSTSRIETAAAPVTRTADLVSAVGGNNAGLLSAESTIVATLLPLGANPVDMFVIALSADDDFNRSLVFRRDNGGYTNYFSGTAHVASANALSKSLVTSSYDGAGNIKLYQKGQLIQDLNEVYLDSENIPGAIYFGRRSGGTSPMYGYIKDFRVYDFELNTDEVTYLAGQ